MPAPEVGFDSVASMKGHQGLSGSYEVSFPDAGRPWAASFERLLGNPAGVCLILLFLHFLL